MIWMALAVVATVAVIAVIAVVSFFLLRRETKVEATSRVAFEAAKAKGALPPSLHPAIDPGRCIGSAACVDACPEDGVLAVVDGRAVLANPTVCIGHGECMRACPTEAIALVIGSEKRGIDIPIVLADFQSNVPGLYIVGELGGMGLVYNATTQALQCVAALKKQRLPKVEGAHQVLIVGCGPAGLAAALACQEAKLDFVVLDQETIGGTVAHYPRGKLVMTRPVTLPLYGKLDIGEITKENLLGIWEDVVSKTGLTVRTGERVDSVKLGADGIFDVKTPKGELRAQRVILAMGRRGSPRKLGVPGEDMTKVIYRLIEPEKYAGRHVLVVGGGDAAVEAAMALGKAGATCTLMHRGKTFDRIKTKNQERLDEIVAQGKVVVLMEGTTKEVRPADVVIAVKGAEQTVKNDDIVVLVGGVLPTAFLNAAGVEVKTFKGEAFAPANQ